MTDQWDYDEAHWDYAHDGYQKVVRQGQVIFEFPKRPAGPMVCEGCAVIYAHYFVSNVDWGRLPVGRRALKLCVDCYLTDLNLAHDG